MRVGRGGLGARASLEVSRRFRNRGNGQTGTVWQLSGRPTDSESDNPAADIELRSVSALRYRLPYLPVCDRQGEEGDRARCGWVHREEGPGGDPGSRKERLAFPPLTLILLTYPGRDRPGKARSHLRGPGAHLIPPHLRADPPGRGRGELLPAPLRPGLGCCIVPVWARSRAFYLSPTPTPSISLGWVLTPCCPGAAPRAGLHPPSQLSQSPGVSNGDREPRWTTLPAVLSWGQGERWGCCLWPHPAGVGRRFLGSPRSWRPAALSAG